MSLARVQSAFLETVLGEAPPLDPGLAIYHRNALAVRREALAAAHPVVRRLVGEPYFNEAAECFARGCPSASGDLHAYGAGFAGFLAAYAPARELPYLPDVARLEWAIHECAHAADGPCLDPAGLGALPAGALDRLRLRLHPAARFVASSHPILAIWEANQPGRDGTPDRLAGAERVLVRRVGLEPAPLRVDPDAWTLLEALARGRTLGESCAVLGRDEAFPAALARLAAWGALGRHILDPA